MAESANVVPVCREILADMETPVTILQKIHAPDRPVFLLESMEGGERWGRYSFLGTSCRSRLRVFRREVEVRQNGAIQKSPHHGDPMGFLRRFMQAFRPAVVPGLPRFWGGLVGYLTYEMVSFFEAIPNRLPDTAPLAEFMLPDQILIFDNLTNTLMLVALIFTADYPDVDSAWRAAGRQLEQMNEHILQPNRRRPPTTAAAWPPGPNRKSSGSGWKRSRITSRPATSSRRSSLSPFAVDRRRTGCPCTGPSAISTPRRTCFFCIRGTPR